MFDKEWMKHIEEVTGRTIPWNEIRKGAPVAKAKAAITQHLEDEPDCPVCMANLKSVMRFG